MLEAALILAGGRSRRMGQPKEALPFGGTTLLERTAAAVRAGALRVVVVGRGGDQQLRVPGGCDLVTDERPEAGPLAAIATGLRALQSGGAAARDRVFVTACDAPFLNAAGIAWLAERLGEHRLVMPRHDGILQPLCSALRVECLSPIDELLAGGIRSPRSIAQLPGANIVDVDTLPAAAPFRSCLATVNTPEEYRQALAASRADGDDPVARRASPPDSVR
ncbi:MAG: molybdenum cofactor guanylyltransferase [Planctomycetes bacterium]|nr:molybdenum cofactor guanylyltransferase [Planctomycetota bacterium]